MLLASLAAFTIQTSSGMQELHGHQKIFLVEANGYGQTLHMQRECGV
jgi:hypothetical protein